MKKLFIVVLTGLVLFSCSTDEQEEVQSTTEHPVTIDISEEKNYTPRIEVTGSIKPYREANLSAILPGRVDKYFYEEGDQVNKGALIAKLASEKLTQAKMEYEVVKKDYQRIKKLYDKGSVTEQKYDHVKGEYKAKKANYELVKSNTEIRAPFQGTLVEKMINEKESFMLMNPGMKSGFSHANGIARFMQMDRLKIEVNINETHLSRIAKGQKATVKTDVYPEQKYSATITQISSLVDQSTRTAEVTLTLNNQNRKLKPGMFCYVTISLEPQENVFIGQNTIVNTSEEKSDYVYVVEDGQAQRTNIKKLYRANEEVAVEGISPGMKIVAEGKMNISDGNSIQVRNK